MASHGNNTLEGLYIKKNNVSEAKGTVTETSPEAQNAKQLIIEYFNKKCNEYFREIFYYIDIDNREKSESLIEEYN